MKIEITLKDPDCLSEPIRDAVRDEVKDIPGLTDTERGALEESRAEEAHESCRRWFEYGEYLRVEVDTVAGTCTVKEVG